MLRLYILVICLWLLGLSGSSQEAKKIRLIQADEALYDKLLGADIQRIIGNAVFEHEGAYLYCDSAHLNNSNNSMKAYSRVHIKSSDTLHLYGDSIYYNGDTKIAQVFDNVKLIDNQTVLTTDRLIFDRNTGIASYVTGGHIVNESNTLDSQRGYYYTNSKDFFFRIDVVLKNPDYTMECDTLHYNTQSRVARFKGPTTIKGEDTDIYTENGWYNTLSDISEFNENARIKNGNQIMTGDSLYYDRVRRFGKAFKNIKVVDTVENVVVLGQYAVYNKAVGYTMITDRAEALLIDKNDTLFMHSDTLKATFDSNEKSKEIIAYYRMKFYKSNLQGMADSLIYSFRDSTLRLHREPVIWTDSNQLTADSIYVTTSNNEVRNLFLNGSAFLVSKDTTGYNQIKGRDMIGSFVKNELISLKVIGNSETIYWVREEDGSLTGINKAFSSNMLITLRDRQIKKITYIEKPTAVLYPQKDLAASDLLLRDFRWLGEKRPLKREDIFNW